MVDLTPIEQKVMSALQEMGAKSEDSVKDAEMIMKRVLMPKSQIGAALQSLMNKKLIKQLSRHKSAGYYVLPQQQ